MKLTATAPNKELHRHEHRATKLTTSVKPCSGQTGSGQCPEDSHETGKNNEFSGR